MKKWQLAIGVLLIAQQLQAQTLAEFTQQKKTQIKYLIEQIAALKVYTDYLEKGYQIAQMGLTTIHHIKIGDFNLHSDHIASFLTVNPKIRAYSKIADITGLQVTILKEYKKSMAQMKSSEWFNSDDIDYATNVFIKLLNDCAEQIDQLMLILSNNQVQMTDDERIKRIEKIYDTVQDQYKFERHFSSSIKILEQQRMNDHNEIQTIQSLYDINN
ncbi:MAG TPA: hypothetical protein VNS32_16775 [Flavisolibacter sp.]|nr:hypothetical protein [Flavisolibacter sp.]